MTMRAGNLFSSTLDTALRRGQNVVSDEINTDATRFCERREDSIRKVV
jgi:hypothetical protein